MLNIVNQSNCLKTSFEVVNAGNHFEKSINTKTLKSSELARMQLL